MSTSSREDRRSSRRRFLQTTIAGSAGLIVAPSFFPGSFLYGQGASPNRRIQIAQIGCGRMGTEDIPLRPELKPKKRRYLYPVFEVARKRGIAWG